MITAIADSAELADFLAQWIFPVARIGASDQPRIWRRELMNTILLQKQIKPLAVTQGLSPL